MYHEHPAARALESERTSEPIGRRIADSEPHFSARRSRAAECACDIASGANRHRSDVVRSRMSTTDGWTDGRSLSSAAVRFRSLSGELRYPRVYRYTRVTIEHCVEDKDRSKGREGKRKTGRTGERERMRERYVERKRCEKLTP